MGARIGVVEFALPRGHRPVTAHAADVYLLFADEAAIPAAQTNLEAFAPGTRVIAFFEVVNHLEEQVISTKADLTLTWRHRGNAAAGTSGLLLRAIRELAWPEGKVFVWACGEMKTVTQIRKFIMEERSVLKGDCKCQAYWRRRKTEVQRMARMTDLTLAAAESDPTALQSSFEEIGMNIEDPTLFDESAPIEVAQNTIIEQDIPTAAEESKLTPLHDTWNITMKTPLGIQKVMLHISVVGGKLMGRMESRVGSSALSDGKIDGDILTWKVGMKFPRRMTFEFSGKVDEDLISGTVKLAALGNATFEGTRG